MKSSTYKWIIGILSFVIVLLFVFFVLSEEDIVLFSFTDAVSLTATVSSILLSVIAMFYTYWAGRDAQSTYSKTQEAIGQIEKQVEKVAFDQKKNFECLSEIVAATNSATKAISTVQNSLNSLSKKENANEEEQEAMEKIQKARNQLEYYLNMMQKNE